MPSDHGMRSDRFRAPRRVTDTAFDSPDMQRRSLRRDPFHAMAASRRHATIRDTAVDPQIAFHDTFRHRMASLLDFSDLIPVPPDEAPLTSTPTAQVAHTSAPFTDAADELQSTLELLDKLEDVLRENAPIDDQHTSADTRAVADTSTQTVAPSASPPPSWVEGDASQGGTRPSWLTLEEEARRRQEWYENYLGWMMYYRHLAEYNRRMQSDEKSSSTRFGTPQH